MDKELKEKEQMLAGKIMLSLPKSWDTI